MPLVQGPLAAPVLQHLTKEDLSKIYFGEFRMLDINGAHCFLTRTGYVAYMLSLVDVLTWFLTNELYALSTRLLAEAVTFGACLSSHDLENNGSIGVGWSFIPQTYVKSRK